MKDMTNNSIKAHIEFLTLGELDILAEEIIFAEEEKIEALLDSCDIK